MPWNERKKKEKKIKYIHEGLLLNHFPPYVKVYIEDPILSSVSVAGSKLRRQIKPPRR